MKRVVYLAALILLVSSLFVFSGCSAFAPQKQPQVIKSFPKDHAPSQVIKTEKQWVILNNTYGSQNYAVSVGESLDSANNIYSVGDVRIWYFEANENAIVWCEESPEFYTFKVYAFETQETETIYQVSADTGFQPRNIGIFLNAAYYCVMDYEQQEVRVLAYNIESKTTTEVYAVEFREEWQPYSINLENRFLSFVCSNQIKVLDLQNNETVFASTLSSSVKHVFGVSYDSKNDTCALYYADNDSEDIGILKEGEDNIYSVFTFSKNHYAYQDKIECYDGHIYWIRQENVSGAVTDHYKLIDYNYLEHKSVETDRTFGFYRSENALYILRFNKGGAYTHIDLCQ